MNYGTRLSEFRKVMRTWPLEIRYAVRREVRSATTLCDCGSDAPSRPLDFVHGTTCRWEPSLTCRCTVEQKSPETASCMKCRFSHRRSCCAWYLSEEETHDRSHMYAHRIVVDGLYATKIMTPPVDDPNDDPAGLYHDVTLTPAVMEDKAVRMHLWPREQVENLARYLSERLEMHCDPDIIATPARSGLWHLTRDVEGAVSLLGRDFPYPIMRKLV